MLELRRVDIYSLERYFKKVKFFYGFFGLVVVKFFLLIICVCENIKNIL